MKAVKFFFGSLALAAVSMIASPNAFAQEDGNRDENGKIVRGPYLTNQLGDNWFVNVGGGLNMAYDDTDWKAGVALSINAGKWFTPSVGARVGYNGLTGLDARYGYFHFDALWNMSNAIGGYKETRLWDFVPYIHAGYVIDNPISCREWGAGAGLLNLIRLTDRLDLTLDVRGNIYKRLHRAGHINTTVGLAVNLGKTNFERVGNRQNTADASALEAAAASAAALEAANAALAPEKAALENEKAALENEKAALENEKAELKKANDELANKNNELEKALSEVQPNYGAEKVDPASFYFEIGKETLTQKELEKLDAYLQDILPKIQGKTKMIVTGSADRQTGSAERNSYLSLKRAEYLMKLMVEKYGVDTSSFEVRTVIPAEGTPSLSRAVKVTFE